MQQYDMKGQEIRNKDNKDKNKAYDWFLKRCESKGIATDTYDFEHEIDSTLSYDEMLAKLDNDFFSIIATSNGYKDKTNKEIKQEAEQYKYSEKLEAQLQQQRDLQKENWERLSTASSIWINGERRTGKTMLAFGLCKKLQQFKPVYWLNFPRKDLLKNIGWHSLSNLDELSKLVDCVVVLDEISLLLKKYEKRNNDELQKILTLAGQNNITLILISQQSQIVNRALESLIDCFILMDCDYVTLKNGSRAKKMIKDYCTFAPEHFKLEKGEFLYYSRNYPVFEQLTKFPIPDGYTMEWSLAYKNEANKHKDNPIKTTIGRIIQW